MSLIWKMKINVVYNAVNSNQLAGLIARLTL